MKFKNSLLFVDIHPMKKKGEVCKNFPLSLSFFVIFSAGSCEKHFLWKSFACTQRNNLWIFSPASEIKTSPQDLWFHQILLAANIKEDEIKLCKYANSFPTSHIDRHLGSSFGKYLQEVIYTKKRKVFQEYLAGWTSKLKGWSRETSTNVRNLRTQTTTETAAV